MIRNNIIHVIIDHYRDSASENNSNDEGNEESDNTNAVLSTETTTPESLPGFSRRTIVKPLTTGELAHFKSVRQGFEDDEMNQFYQEMRRKSPNESSLSAGNNTTQPAAARSRGANDSGWSPSRPRRPPPRRDRANGNVNSPARSRMPPVSPAARRTIASQPQQSQHNYRTRANR